MKKNRILIIILSGLAMGLQAQEEKTFWDNGNLKSVTNHDKDGVKNGNWKIYHQSGELKEYGYYEYGDKSGTWNEYYYDGTKKKRTSYLNGLIKDKKIYYENGRLMVTGRFDDNEKKHGTWEQKYNNWKQKLKGDYSHGKKHGLWKYYTETGKIFKIENYREGVKISKWEGFNEYSDEYVVENVARVQSVVEVVESTAESVVETRSYYGNRLNGQWKFYNERGKVIEKGYYKDDRKDGKWTYYYGNGQIKKVEMRKEDKLMEVLSYFDNKGKSFDKGTLKDGNGTVIEYDSDNNVISNIEYINGEKLDWNNSNNLNSLAWAIYENETNVEMLQNGIKMVKRSIELDKSYYNTDTYAALLFKTSKYKQALTVAKEAIKIAKKEGDSYKATTKLIEQINKKMKK